MKPINYKANPSLRLSFPRILSILFVFLSYNLSMNCQVPGWAWGGSIGGAGGIIALSNDVSTINGGAVYTLGSVGGVMDIDPGPDSLFVNSGAGVDLFIIKQNSAGDFVWGRTVGGTDLIFGHIIAINEVHGESVYVAGQFSGTVDFDPGPNIFEIESIGSNDCFIMKLDSNGIFQWAKSIGGNGNDQALSLAVDPQEGFVYTTGSYQGTTDFDPGQNTYLLQAVGSADIFISKLDENGSFVWAKSIGSGAYDYGASIAIYPGSGDLYTTGKFSESADFNPGPGSYIMHSDASIFILKLNSAGSFVWAKQIENTFTNNGRIIGVDSTGSGSVYLAGMFTGSTDFDPGTNTFTMDAAGFHDIFILKIAITGDFIWAKQIGGEEYEYCYSIVVPYASNGEIYITGEFAESIDFDPGSNVFMLTSTDALDIFISRINNQGDLDWAVAMGGEEGDSGASIALDPTSTIGPFITGGFYGSVDFDPGPGIFNLTEGSVYNLSLDTAAMFGWANSWSGDQQGFAMGRKIAMHPVSGISVSVGEFYGKVDFDPGSGTQIKIAESPQDIFITCLDAQGQWSWTKAISCIDGRIIAKSIQVDQFDHSIYLLGQFNGLIDFNPGSGIENISAPESEYSGSTFLLKLTASGEFLWVKTITGDLNGNNCWNNDLSIDACGHIYIAGDFSFGPVDFDPGPAQFFMTASEYSGYIIKLDTLGHFIWAKRIGIDLHGSVCGSSANSIAISPKGEAMNICGMFFGTCDLDESGNEYNTGPEFDTDMYILKIDSAGLTQWVKTIGQPYNNDEVVSISTDRNAEKNIYLLGRYDGQVDFDPDTGTHIIYTYNGAYDVFLLKLDSLGRFIWVDGFGGLWSDIPIDMTVDTFGQVIYLLGMFFENMDADPGYGVENLVALGYEDLFFISIDETGSLKYAEAIGTPSYDQTAGISDNAGARVMLTGTFDYPTMSLGSLIVENAGAPGNEDAFIGLYEGCMGVVINTFDNGFGSLRREIDCASNGDTIDFNITLPNQITLTSGEIPIQKNITLSGPGIEQLSISGNNASRIFNLGEGYSFGLKGLTLKQAAFPSLGGAMLLRGQASLENVRLQQNLENGLPKAISLIYPGELIVKGSVEIKF